MSNDMKLFYSVKNNLLDSQRGSQHRRFVDMSIVDQMIILDTYCKKSKSNLDVCRYLVNFVSKRFNNKKKILKKNFFFRANYSKKTFYFLQKRFSMYNEAKSQSNVLVGNLIHNSCTFSGNESDSKLSLCEKISFFSRQNFFHTNHVNLLKKIDGVEYQKGIYVSGNRGYFLKKFGFLFNIALIQFGLDFLEKSNFVPIQTPYFMKKNMMIRCAQLEDFKEQLYSVQEEAEKFLIATSEQPISALHSDEKISFDKLPIRYTGFSTCFRKESGSHGIDTSGIFRVHQFEKIEQFVICNSLYISSWVFFEELVKNASNFYLSLKIPFFAIDIPSGILNNSACKKIDILGWFPVGNAYRELVSCSNCTNFQSRKLNITVKINSHDNKFVCMLNSTLCATSRLICCILENYQNYTGIKVPNVLKSYIGVSFIFF